MRLSKNTIDLSSFAISLASVALVLRAAEPTPVYNSDWAYCTAITISENFQTLYIPHALAIMEAERQVKANTPPEAITALLANLPGVKYSVVADSKSQPDIKLSNEASEVYSALLKEPRLFKNFKSPMMHKLLGGKCMWQRLKVGESKLDLIAHGFYPVENDTSRKIVVALVLDKSWLIPQIPTIMDSLAQNNTQMLFWGPSPTNTFWAQSIGVVYGKDTLWWQGPKEVKFEAQHALWPFEEFHLFSHLHNLTK